MSTHPTNGHGPAAAGTIARTPSFQPVTPVVKARVGVVAERLSEVEKMVEDINIQSAEGICSPTMGDLKQEIDLLQKDIRDVKVTQSKEIEGLKNNVRSQLKQQISGIVKAQTNKTITHSIEAQVKTSIRDWGELPETKKFSGELENLLRENDELIQNARIKLNNSRSRHENSTLDEHEDFETNLAGIRLPDGNVSRVFPKTLKALFSYDEKNLRQLFNEYELQPLESHLENLNRFLSFIGLRFSIPEQSLTFLDVPPPYVSPDVLEPSKEANTPEIPHPNLENQVKQKGVEKPPAEFASANDKTTRTRAQGKNTESDAQRDRVGPDIELSTVGQQQTATATDHRLHQTSSNSSLRSTSSFTSASSHQQTTTGNTQGGGKGVGGWLKSAFADF